MSSEQKPIRIAAQLTEQEKATTAKVLAAFARWGLPVKKLEVFREPRLDESEESK